MLGWLKRKVGGDGIRLRPRDCHTHVIPGVDDGARRMDESLAMLSLLQADGATTVVATSHMFPARFNNQPDDLRRGFAALQEAAHAAQIDIELALGAEHYLDEGFGERIAAGKVLPFGPERYVLFETTTGRHAPPSLLTVVHDLSDRGYVPLVAHIERYAYLRGEEGQEMVEDLRAAGARFQVNRTVGKANRPGLGSRGKMIAWLAELDWIDEVGSDLHRPTREGRPYTGDELGR